VCDNEKFGRIGRLISNTYLKKTGRRGELPQQDSRNERERGESEKNGGGRSKD